MIAGWRTVRLLWLPPRRRTDTGYELTSMGGGIEPDPTLTITSADPWEWTNLSEDRVKNTDRLGLIDQSNGGLTYDNANFHFCDMLATEYKRRLAALPKARTSPYFLAMDAHREFDHRKYPHDMHHAGRYALAAPVRRGLVEIEDHRQGNQGNRG